MGGTGDAKRIASALVGHDVIVSLAGATRVPDRLPVQTRVGGFGGRQGFVNFLKENAISRVLDVTHPFASKITQRTAETCAALGLPHLLFVREPWIAEDGDNWIEINAEEDARNHVITGQTIFLGTGRQTLLRFANLSDCRVICRQIDSPTTPFPFEGGEFLVGRPPFSVAHERKLFRDLNVDWLVVKNAGGELSKTKLTAARELNIPVLMIARPQLPQATIVRNVEEAIAWAKNNG